MNIDYGNHPLSNGKQLGYRAAFIGDCVLTGPEHAELSDADLMTEAEREFFAVGGTPEDAASIAIGTWIEP